MGIAKVKWNCPTCKKDVGGSLGDLKHHIKKVHSKPEEAAKVEQTRFTKATAA